MTPLVIVACALGVVVGLLTIRWYLCRRIAHILLGSQRRALFPLEEPIGPGAEAVLASEEINVSRKLYDLKSGMQLFCQILTPKHCAPSHVVVFLHGYTSQGDLYLEAVSSLVRKGAVVMLPDLPCHGRSDGLLAYVPDWWSWVAQLWELLDGLVPSVRARPGGGAALPMFVGGISLGGGLAACLTVQRPNFFNGVFLVAPMLGISDDIRPPWIVEQVFQYLFAPLLPTWPLTPTKSMEDFDFRVPEQGQRYVTCNPLSMQGLKTRLGTAVSFGFTFCDWMKAKLPEVKTPFIVLHGTADKITDPTLSRRLYEEAAARDKSAKFYEGAFHCELFCCLPNNGKLIGMDWLPEQVDVTETCFDDIASWIAERI